MCDNFCVQFYFSLKKKTKKNSQSASVYCIQFLFCFVFVYVWRETISLLIAYDAFCVIGIKKKKEDRFWNRMCNNFKFFFCFQTFAHHCLLNCLYHFECSILEIVSRIRSTIEIAIENQRKLISMSRQCLLGIIRKMIVFKIDFLRISFSFENSIRNGCSPQNAPRS